jgi:ketol-acid reductoisomerase
MTTNKFTVEALQGQTVAVLGYGSQGRAHALNARDSGVETVVGLRPEGASWRRAHDEDGFDPVTVEEATRQADLVAVLVPDMVQRSLVMERVVPNLRSGATVLFAHGFAVHYGQVQIPSQNGVSLVAPKSPGDLVRREYAAGRGVPCLMAVHQDPDGATRARTVAYTAAIGCARAGVMETSFAEETETDLFGEQAVLCGGVTELITAGFETLTGAGYRPEVAYFECLHELKLIVDLIYEGGLEKLHTYVSETAIFGDLTRGPRVVGAEARARMKEVLEEIQTGSFAREWLLENQVGKPTYQRLLARDLQHPIEDVGRKLRARMAWLEEQASDAQ